MMNFPEQTNAFFIEHDIRDSLLITDNKLSLNFQNLQEIVAEIAQWLHNIETTAVAIKSKNSMDWILVDLACQVANIICIPLPDYFSEDQLQHAIEQTQADLFLSSEIFVPIASNTKSCIQISTPSLLTLLAWQLHWDSPDEAQALIPDHTQKITFTSGSTGNPKGVCLSTDHQWQVATSLANVIDIDQPKHLCLLPLATLLENVAGVYASLQSGGEIILLNDSERGFLGSSGLDLPKLLQCLDQHQPNTLILIPQLLSALVAACQTGWQPPKSLKFVAVGGAKVSPLLIAQARDFGIPVFEGYGLSECGSVVALNTKNADQVGSTGKILPHCQVEVQQQEMIVKGSCHLGYLGDPMSWYPTQINTGDLGFIDQQNYLHINGRKKNVLISSFGRNISPEWIESCMLATPLLSQCVVLGDDKPYLSAILSAADHVSNQTISHWIESVNQSLPDYAHIKNWARVEPIVWQGLFTANGRPKRKLITEVLHEVINSLYTSQNAFTQIHYGDQPNDLL